MYIDIVPNRNSPPAVLLRESVREGGKVVKKTVGNLTGLPPEIIAAVRLALSGRAQVPAESLVEVVRSRPHGHVRAIRLAMERLGMAGLLSSRPCRERDIAMALVAQRLVEPATKLRSVREFGLTTLAEEFGVEDVTADQAYAAMDWLQGRQKRIEAKLAKRHVGDGDILFYDVSCSSYHGTHCSLAKRGYNRDGLSLPSIAYGLLVGQDGPPLAIEAYPGNTADPKTVPDLLARLGQTGRRVILAGDRGMLMAPQIEQIREMDGMGWLSCLRSGDIRKILRDSFQTDAPLFDRRGLVEIAHPDFPGERIVLCYNPILAEDRRRTREELLDATEAALEKIREWAGKRTRPAPDGLLGRKAGVALARHKVGKHFDVTIEEGRISWTRNAERIAEETRLDGLYAVRTSESAETLPAEEAVRRYKELEKAERAFRTFKGVDLRVRPIHHRLDKRVRTHLFLCMLAYYVEWHMRKALAPLLFDDEDLDELRRTRDPVAPAQASDSVRRKKARRTDPDDSAPVAWTTLLSRLATIVRNECAIGADERSRVAIRRETTPTPWQRQAFQLLEAYPWPSMKRTQ